MNITMAGCMLRNPEYEGDGEEDVELYLPEISSVSPPSNTDQSVISNKRTRDISPPPVREKRMRKCKL